MTIFFLAQLRRVATAAVCLLWIGGVHAQIRTYRGVAGQAVLQNSVEWQAAEKVCRGFGIQQHEIYKSSKTVGLESFKSLSELKRILGATHLRTSHENDYSRLDWQKGHATVLRVELLPKLGSEIPREYRVLIASQDDWFQVCNFSYAYSESELTGAFRRSPYDSSLFYGRRALNDGAAVSARDPVLSPEKPKAATCTCISEMDSGTARVSVSCKAGAKPNDCRGYIGQNRLMGTDAYSIAVECLGQKGRSVFFKNLETPTVNCSFSP